MNESKGNASPADYAGYLAARRRVLAQSEQEDWQLVIGLFGAGDLAADAPPGEVKREALRQLAAFCGQPIDPQP